ncbi:hypothetical protein Taro_046430, partial [Colocasia esculenta]|nr:hypothetical protein [Colocasia esculenta]
LQECITTIKAITTALLQGQLFFQIAIHLCRVQDIGVVLSTDAKPRWKLTSELHERFTEAVNQLGGAQSNTKDNHEVDGCSWTHLIAPKEPSSGATFIPTSG